MRAAPAQHRRLSNLCRCYGMAEAGQNRRLGKHVRALFRRSTNARSELFLTKRDESAGRQRLDSTRASPYVPLVEWELGVHRPCSWAW
jgi:hypothetical protein